MSRPPRALVVLVVVTLSGGVLAGDREQPAAGSGFLAAPEIYKLDWNTRSLVAHDLDGDGRVDLAIANNDRARIDLLLQLEPGKKPSRKSRRKTQQWEPVLEDSRFDRASVVTGGKIFALAVGDVDSDGLADLAYTGDLDHVTVRYQGPKGDWTRQRVLDTPVPTQWTNSLAIEDLDRDGRNDLVVLGSSEIAVYSPGPQGVLASPHRLPLASDKCYGLVVYDVDGDGRPDLSYLQADSAFGWCLRFQRSDGSFGPERRFRIDTPRRRLTPVRSADASEATLVGVNDRTGLIEFHTLGPHGGDGRGDYRLSPRVYSTPTSQNGSESFALGDFDGDGRDDLAVADGRGAQVWLYLQRDDGTFAEALAFPSFSGVRGLAAASVDGSNGRDGLVVVSHGEEVVGLSRFSSEGRLDYPAPFDLVGGKPLAVAVADLDGDGALEAAVAVTGDGTRSVAIVSLGGDGGGAESGRYDLEELRTDPSAIRVHDADQDGRPDLLVFVPRSPMRLLLQNDEGAFVPASAERGFRKGLVDGLLPSRVTSADLDGDGLPEILAGDSGFARAMRLTPEGVLTVVDQFNADDREDEVACALATDLDGDGQIEIVLVIEGDDRVQVLRRGRKGVFRFQEAIPVGSIDAVGALVQDLEGDGRPEVIVLGRDRFWIVPLGGPDLEVQRTGSHETGIEGMAYVELAVGDLNGDGADELIAVDTRESKILEILRRNGTGAWDSVLHFPVFDIDPHYGGRQGTTNEPREIVINDVTSDGVADVAILVHDRILVYPGIPAPAAPDIASDAPAAEPIE